GGEVGGVRGLAHRKGGVGAAGPCAIDEGTPYRIEVGFGPVCAGAFRFDRARVEAVEHPAVAQDDKALIEVVAVRFGVGEDLRAPLYDGLADLGAEVGGGNG